MRKDRGFTLIELLIVVAIIGIIAAIAIPNLLNAIHRGRQKRSMADMRTIATAIGTYATDLNYYPRGMATLADFEPVPGSGVPAPNACEGRLGHDLRCLHRRRW